MVKVVPRLLLPDGCCNAGVSSCNPSHCTQRQQQQQLCLGCFQSVDLLSDTTQRLLLYPIA
jgi:hypothetical protein